MVQCFVKECGHRGKTHMHWSQTEACKLFRFPSVYTAPRERQAWIDLIGRTDKEPNEHSKVCACHFVDGNKKNGPTIFFEHDVSQKSRKRKNKSEVDEDQMEFVPERKNPSNVSDLLDQDVESIKNLEAVLHVEKVYKEHVRKRNDVTMDRMNRQHNENFCKSLFQFYSDGFLCDTFIATKEKELKAHSVVLATWSPFFLLSVSTYGANRGGSHKLNLSNFDTDVVEIILNYTYTGELSVKLESLENDKRLELYLLVNTLGLSIEELEKFELTFENERSENTTFNDLSEIDQIINMTCKDEPDTETEDNEEDEDEQTDETELDCAQTDSSSARRSSRISARRKRSLKTRKTERVVSPKNGDRIYKSVPPSDTRKDKDLTPILSVPKSKQLHKNRIIRLTQNCKNMPNSASSSIKKETKEFDNNCPSSAISSQSSQKALVSLQLQPATSQSNSSPGSAKVVPDANPFAGTLQRKIMHLLDNDPQLLETDLPRTHKCDVCSQFFPSECVLEMHQINMHHLGQNKERSFNCNICGKSYSSDPYLQAHYMRVHSNLPKVSNMPRNIKCDQCNLMFKIPSHLNMHKRSSHGEAIPFQDQAPLICLCDLCGRSYQHEYQLRKHRLHVHGDGKPHLYMCFKCGKSFKAEVRFNEHMNIHKGEKPYKCPYCSKCFPGKTRLGAHMHIHAGVKRHKCHVCNKEFHFKHNMKTHVKKNHSSPELSI